MTQRWLTHTEMHTARSGRAHKKKKTANGHSDNSYFFMLLLMLVVLRCSLCLPCYLDCFYYDAFQCHSLIRFLSSLFCLFIYWFSFFCVIRLHHKNSFNTMFMLCMLTPDLQPCRVFVQDYLHYTLVLYYLAFWYCTHTHRERESIHTIAYFWKYPLAYYNIPILCNIIVDQIYVPLFRPHHFDHMLNSRTCILSIIP